MKALVLDAPGEPPRLSLTDVPTPSPGPRDVLVQVAACGVCGHDVAVMRGLLRRGVRPGLVLGHEVSGLVAAVGGEVTSLREGDRVISALTVSCGECRRCLSGREYRCTTGVGVGHGVDGGFAEYILLPERSVCRVPEHIPLRDAALLACPVGVALRAVREVAAVRAGETVLITGAGGGLGVHLVQVAAALGAHVLAVTTSADKVAPLERLAPCRVILAGDVDFPEVALALTDDGGVDVVIDTVGSAVFRSYIRCLAQFGRVVLLGDVAGGATSISLGELLLRDATLVGATGATRRHIEAAVGMVSSGKVRPVVSATFGLAEAATAYGLMRSGQTFGRVVLTPG